MEPASMHMRATTSTGSCPSRASLRPKQQRKLHLRLLWRKKSVISEKTHLSHKAAQGAGQGTRDYVQLFDEIARRGKEKGRSDDDDDVAGMSRK